jgi:hypothetical protein
MNGVFIIPTGIGCKIGGHSGDAVLAANLVASVCTNLLIHPNVVNASDINEMAPNCLYVEGSILDRFLAFEIGLTKVRANRILLAANKPVTNLTYNSMNAARISLGIDIDICELNTPLTMKATFNNDGVAVGDVDAIEVPDDVVNDYLEYGGVNPWGGVEAKASRLIASALNKPVAHAPVENENSCFKNFNEIVDPRMSAELVSKSYIHCVYKGLAKAPRPCHIGYRHSNLDMNDIDFLITPDNCYGTPHFACQKAGVPVIVVENNDCILNKPFPSSFVRVKNYLEAVGYIQTMATGMNHERLFP